MKYKWYILLYHNISWEDNPYTRALGNTCPPDYFREHLNTLALSGKFVSIDEGIKMISEGELKEPIISIWFDDGYAGLSRYALPLMEQRGVVGAVSICSRFVERTELSWRCKVSFLNFVDGMRFLRSALRKRGYKTGDMVKDFCIDNFSEELAGEIDEIYKKFTNEDERIDAYRIFEDEAGLKELTGRGWTICNHTAAHYPVGEDVLLHELKNQFLECEGLCDKISGRRSEYWIVPFDRPGKRSERLTEVFRQSGEGRYLTLVGNKAVQYEDIKNKMIYRIEMPVCRGKDLLSYEPLKALTHNIRVAEKGKRRNKGWVF